eukprot:jgi/Chlat1/3468/Chrsp23S03785
MAVDAEEGVEVLEQLRAALVQHPIRPPPALELVDFQAANIQPKQANELVRLLTAVAPLERMPHVKRVRRVVQADGSAQLVILLCPLSGTSSPLPEPVATAVAKQALQPHNVQVPLHAPRTRQQWEEWNKIWPMSFHPNASDAVQEEATFTRKEVGVMRTHMLQALALSRVASTSGQLANAAVIVDPAGNQVVAVGIDQTKAQTGLAFSDSSIIDGILGCNAWQNVQQHPSGHPLKHAVISAIDAAACRDVELFPHARNASAAELDFVVGNAQVQRPECCSQTGEADEDSAAKRRRMEDGQSPVDARDAVTAVSADQRPYLCTGFDLYVIREPCAMCAMAAVHQRFRRVIYGVRNPQRGALGSKYKLHQLKSLNHHYEVVEGLLLQGEIT